MKQFPTLYSRASTKKIQQWTFFVDGDSYYMEHGQQGGKIQRSAPTVALQTNEGRANHRNPEQQAEFEAQAAWDKKQKSGGYSEDIAKIDVQKFVKPMLADKFLDRKDKIKYPVISQCKYNGGRCVATKEGLFSRKGERYMNVPHIENSLKEFFVTYPDAVLDGELMGTGFKACLNETMKLIRKTVKVTPETIAASEKLVRFWVYDGYGFDGISKTTGYLVRQSAIGLALMDNPYYHQVPSIICNNESEVMAHYQELIEDGEEGSIIRILDKPYENKRSANLLKMKPEDDDEGEILAINEGTGNWAGTGKVITLKWNGIVFDGTFKGKFEQGVEFLKNKDQWIGKTVTFLYNGLTGLGVPNYARVDINNCLK